MDERPDVEAHRPPPRCVECGQVWVEISERGWQTHLLGREPVEAVFFCPACAAREFGDRG